MNYLQRIPVQLLFVLALTLILAAPAAAQERRFSVPDGTDFSALVENPQVIAFDVDTSPPEPATTASIGDVHAVYPLPLAALRDTLTDFAGHPDFMPRVAESQAEKVSEDPAVWELRYFNSIYFARDQFGLRLGLRNQGARDMQNAMNALYEEAERRQ